MLGRIRRLKEDQGFTLIELLIVIIILGILAAIVIFGVSTFRRDAAKRACETDVKQVKVAVQAYRAKTGSYPSGGAPGQAQLAGPDLYLETWPTATEYTVNLGASGAVTSTPLDCEIT